MNPIGIIVSFVYPFFFVDPDASEKEIRASMRVYFITFAVISTIWLIFTLIFYFEKKEGIHQEVRNFGLNFTGEES